MSPTNMSETSETSTTLSQYLTLPEAGNVPFEYPCNGLQWGGLKVIVPMPLGARPDDIPTIYIKTTPTVIPRYDGVRSFDNPYFGFVQLGEGVYTGKTSPWKLIYQPIASPMRSMAESHRYVAGSLGVGIRINSSGLSSGNLKVTTHTDLHRRYKGSFDPGTPYPGANYLGFNCWPATISSANDAQSFALNDLSQCKNFIIKSPSGSGQWIDQHLWRCAIEEDNDDMLDSCAELFPESYIALKFQTDAWSPDITTLNMELYFDWKEVKFHSPLYPARGPISRFAEDILPLQYFPHPTDYEELTRALKLGNLNDKDSNKESTDGRDTPDRQFLRNHGNH